MTVTPSSDAQIIPFYLTSGAENVALIRGQLPRWPAGHGNSSASCLSSAIAKMQAEALADRMSGEQLKFEGIFTLQAKGDALVRTLFADMTSMVICGYAP